MGFSKDVKGANEGEDSTAQSDQSQNSPEVPRKLQTEDYGDSNAEEYSMNKDQGKLNYEQSPTRGNEETEKRSTRKWKKTHGNGKGVSLSMSFKFI